MRFLLPSLLGWLGVLAVPVVLYLFRRKPREVKVSTLLFFKTLARAYQESAWLRWLKRVVSFLLTVAVILCAVFALARLVVSPRAGDLKGVVLLVDRSASMAAKDSGGATRLEEGVRAARARLAGLGGGVAVAVMTYDRRPEILLPFTLDRRDADRALDIITVRPVEGDGASALALARKLAAIESPAAIWHVTDEGSYRQDAKDAKDDEDDTGHTSERAAVPLGDLGALAVDAVAVEPISVPLVSPVNAGLTAFQLRRLPLERGKLEAFIQVHCATDEPREVGLETRVDGALVSLRTLTIGPGPGGKPGRERLLVPLKAGEGEAISLKVSVDGDCLSLDDEVHAFIPELKPVRVLWVAPEPRPFTELALASLGADEEIEIFRGGPEVWPPAEPVDVVIFEGWLPDEWPGEVPVIAIDPPGSAGPFAARRIEGEGLPVEGVRASEERHPLLYGVATARVAVTQTSVLESAALEPVWVGVSGPLVLAGEASGQRVVVMGFDPGRSERLPLMASYPLLMGNAIYWCASEEGEALAGAARRTGELVRLEGKSIRWTTPSAGGAREETLALEGRWTELDRAGLWRTDAREFGSTALLSARETLVPSKRAAAATAQAAAAPGGASGPLAGDLAPTLLWLALGVLAAEAWLFHRRAVY